MCSRSDTTPSPRIFISYAREDEDAAEELYQFLKSAGADPWLDKRQLVPGDAWKSEVKRAISDSDFFVACLRPEDDRRGFHHAEVRLALAEAGCRPPGKTFIIPFVVKPCELPDWAQDIHAGADLTVPSRPIDILRAVDKNLGTSLASRASETLVVSPGEKLVVPPPAGSAGQLLPFAALSEYQFQDFCCALLEKDPHVVSVEIYGVRGQSQRGIDLKGPIAEGNGLVVGQCKRYEKISISEVRSASDVFFDHLDYWRQKNIRRFVLFVSCRMDMTQLQDQIDEETKRFSEAGIAYEVWHQRRLTEKACSAPQLVERFFHPFGREWLGVIGALPVSTSTFDSGTRHAMDVVHLSVVERLVEVSDQATEERLAQIRSLIEQGRVTTAHESLEVLKESSFWQAASPESRASVLRVEAGLLLQEPGKLDAAQLLADAARGLAPSADERTLRAMLARVRFGPEAGLAELEGTPTLRVLNLRAQLQLEAGEPAACEETLEKLLGVFDADAETHRTRCLLSLVQRNVDSAVQAAERAVEQQPSSAVARFAVAIAYFWSGIAPAALPSRLLALPPPIDSRFVLQNAVSQERLSIAANYLDELLEIDSGRAFGPDSLLAWKLACLAIAAAGLDQARAICEEELELKSPSPSVVRWACARGWVTDLGQLGERLRSEYNTDDPEQVEIVVQCLLASGKTEAALQHLRPAKRKFTETGNEEAFHLLELECLYRLGDEQMVSDAVRRAEGTQVADLAILTIARSTYEATGDAIPLVKELEKQWQTHRDPRLLLDLCGLKAITRDWRFVVEHAEPLLRDVPTPAVLLLYVMALYNTGQYETCLERISANAQLFGGESIPPRLLAVRASARRALGLVSAALRDARDALEHEPSEENVMRVLKLLFESGDREALVVEARQLLDMESVETGNLILLAQATREQKRELSRRLLTRALAQILPDDLVVPALVLALELLNPDDSRTAQLMKRAMELGEQGVGGIHLASQSEFEVFVKDRARGAEKAFELYFSGQIPIHLLSDALNEPLGALMPLLFDPSHAVPEARATIPFVRSGRMFRRLPSQIRMRRLLADYPALVISEALGILDALERELDAVLVPFHILVSLQEAEDRMVQMRRQKDPGIKDVDRWICTIQELRERLRLGVESGAYALLPEFPNSPEEEAPALGLSARCLRGLLLADTQEGDIVWSDDRYLNGHSMIGVAPIASTYELLAHLQNVGALTQEERFAANHTLRSWRCMFLPLEKEEIAHVASSGEAEPKRILRQWVATTYLNGTALQINPANAPSGMGEFKLFLDLHRAVEDSIIQIWADESADLDVREERATWVLGELFASALTVRRQTNLSRGQENSLQLEALSASALFTHAFLQLKPTIWNRYFDWLDGQVLQPRGKCEPLLVRAIAEGISAMLLNRKTWAEFDFGEQEKRYLSVFAASLPESLKPFVLEDQEVREELGFTTTVTVQRFDFTADEFYRGMTKVQEEGSANLELLEGEDTVSVSAIGELPAQEFTLREPDGTEIKFTGEELVLLHGTAGERRSFLEERRHWFDCNQREFRQRVERIASDPDPRRRAEAARAAKSSSISVFLQTLRARLAETGSFGLQSLLPPDSAAAISYFGLDRIGDEESAAAEMLKEMSESEALSRFIALPSPLPKILEERLVSLQPQDRLAAIENVLQGTRSPISIFHIARLMMVAPAEPDSVARAQQLLLSSLSPEGREEAELLLRILAWAESQLAYDREVDHAPIAVQVALPWAWASIIHSTFILAGADPRKLTEIFEQGRAAQIPASVLSPGSLLTADISRSRNQSVGSLLLSGVAFALGEGAPYLDELVGAMSDLLFLENGEGHTLSLTLWQNTSGAADALQSFLGGTWEEKLKPLLGEASANISNAAAGNRVRLSLQVIRSAEDESPRAWTTLQAVLGDFPVPGEWREDVAACLADADLRHIVADDATRGALAYYFACGQARYLADEGVTSNLAAQVGELSHHIVCQQADEKATASWLLFDAILRLAAVAPSALDASRMAAELFGEAVRDAPELAIVWEPGIWALANRLPLEQGQAFWPLLLRIRAGAMGEPASEASQA